MTTELIRDGLSKGVGGAVLNLDLYTVMNRRDSLDRIHDFCFFSSSSRGILSKGIRQLAQDALPVKIMVDGSAWSRTSGREKVDYYDRNTMGEGGEGRTCSEMDE